MNTNLKKYTSFKIGGEAEKLFLPSTLEEFVQILNENRDAKVLGNCSNVLISSINAGKIILTSEMKDFYFEGNLLYASCGVKMPLLSRKSAENSLSGLEFAIGFPASVGGAIYMNASANSQTTSEIFKSAKVFDGKNVIKLNDMDFSYRHSILKEKPYILLEAVFELQYKNRDEIEKRMDENLKFRKKHQPNLTLPNAGSVFKNPKGDSAGRLLDLCGVKNLKYGGAKVWENHSNFIVNVDNATSEDVTGLMFEMYNKVKEKFGIELVPEIEYIGKGNDWEKSKWDIMLKRK